MWIDISEMKYLLDHAEDMPSYIRAQYENDLKRAEARERKALEEKAHKVAVLRDRIYDALSDGRSLTPTDIQFVIYNRYGYAYSLPKITYHVAYMTFGLTGEDAERWKGVEHDCNTNCGRGKSYFHIVK